MSREGFSTCQWFDMHVQVHMPMVQSLYFSYFLWSCNHLYIYFNKLHKSNHTGVCIIQKVVKFTHFPQKTTHINVYKFVNMHIYYSNRVNIHNYCSCVNNFLLSPTHQTSPFLFSPKSLLSPSSSSSLSSSSSHSLPLSSSKQDKAGPTTVQPPHPSQKSHLS